MGLDISVYKIEKLNGRNPESIEEFFTLEECPELEIFKEFAFEKENGYYDLETDAKNQGYNIDDLVLRSFSSCPTVYVFNDKEGNEVKIVEPTIIKKIERCLTYSCISEQRKGANKQFYEDEIWDSPCVVDTKTLNEHWKKYFSHNTPESKGGFGYGVEFKLEDEEMKNRFKKNIIDNFIEGETFVVYN